LPPGYDLQPERRYPVFYLHDGQNLFDDEYSYSGIAWRCDETADRLARAGEIEPIILVGIANSPDRLREYGPRWSEHDRAEDWSGNYGRFIVEEVKPFIDHHYRSLPDPENTAVGGASMGGLISLHLCKWYPDVFSICAAMSPSLWWDGEHFLQTLDEDQAWLKNLRIWVDMGGRESATAAGAQAGLRRVRELSEFLQRAGLGRRLHHLEVPDGQHNEAAWGARFDRVLKAFFETSR
jgi:predicted alpha/beta superfamily hydrolase